jgi:predicted metal-binding protein
VWPESTLLPAPNCTQTSNYTLVVCLADMRQHRGFFERYPKDEPLDLIGIINCAGCPTIAALEKILRKARAVASGRKDARRLSLVEVPLAPLIKNNSN